MKIAIIGGDKRMLFAARAFADEGYEVFLAGFDHLLSLCDIQVCSVEEAAQRADIIILPVKPLVNDDLNMPFSERRIPIGDLMKLIGKKPIFTGFAEQLQPFVLGEVYDYAARDDFTLKNAQLTAEGALGLLIAEYEGAVHGTRVLVTGYGRIGKYLSAYLKALGADVAVAARKSADRRLAEQNALTAVDYPQINYADYAVIFNTVPALVMDQTAVDSMREDVFIIDLASKPGGVDFERAAQRDLSCIHALSLPGKTAPLAAGTIIKDTVIKILSRG